MKNLGVLTFALAIVVLFGVQTLAADITVDETCSLANAIRAANTDEAVGGCPAGNGTDVLSLTEDVTLAADTPAVSSVIIIQGNNFDISGDGKYRILFVSESATLRIENVTLHDASASDITFSSGNIARVGGAIYSEGLLIITNSNFNNNYATDGGGAIYNNDGELAISLSTFSINSSDNNGGAIVNDGPLAIADSVFSGNSSLTHAGAVVIIHRGEISISRSEFENNSATYFGGAIYNFYAQLDILSSSFSNNTARHGGGISNAANGDLIINNTSFKANSAVDGGAIYIVNGESSVSGSSFDQNLGRSGGAVYNLGELSFYESTFDGNTAFEGGAVFNSGKLAIIGSTFHGNTADVTGGAVFNMSVMSAGNSSFIANQAHRGGAILFRGDEEQLGTAELTHTTIANNSAEQGGGIHVESITIEVANLYNSIVAQNAGGDCLGKLTMSENSIIQDGSCDAKLSGDPMLGELVVPDDGSPAYFPLLVDSPAIDSANIDFCPVTDQIGTARPQGEGCDIGAIEFVPEQ